MQYQCSVCGKVHDDLPHIGCDRPAQFWDVAQAERARRIKLTSDTCVIDDELFFVRGVIEISIHDYPENFGFGVWVSHKKENFESYVTDPNSAEVGPFFGWLSTEIAYYSPSTQLLKTMAHYRGDNLRPSIILEPSDHPLSQDQQNCITIDKAFKIVHYYMKNENRA
jgi:hypothetical protein